jgi:predicted phage terminase large subunit-like protein
MVSSSIGGSALGKGGRRVIIDDPIDPDDAYSDAKRIAANNSIERKLPSRLNVPGRDAMVMVMQRLHEDDPSGRILANKDNNWVHCCVPAECKERTTITYPRSGNVRIREVGEVLWPDRVNQHDLDNIKHGDNMSLRDFEAQYNQNPSPASGTMFNRNWWQFYVQLPVLDEVIQSWDLTFDQGNNADYVVGLVLGCKGAQKYVIDMVRERADFPATLRMFRLLSQKWPMASVKLVEKAANGAALISTLRKEIDGIIPVTPKGSKVVRAQSVTSSVECGNVLIPALSLDPLRISPEWQLFIDEHSRFPNGVHDDIVDAASQGLTRLSRPMLIATTTEN